MSTSRSTVLAPPRTPVKKKSMPEFSAATTPQRGQPMAIGSFAQAAPVSLSPPQQARNSPSRGLTIQIENDMSRYNNSKSIQSAPIRATRRLPAPPPPFTSIPETPSATFPPVCTPSTSASARTIRPLPFPPTLAKNNAALAVSNSPPSSTTKRYVRPLPIPVPKTEPSLSIPTRPKPALSLSQSSHSQNKPISLPIPSPSVIATFPHPDVKVQSRRHHHTSSENLRTSKNKASLPRKLQASRSYTDLPRIDVVQLHKQFVVNRKPSYMSFDSDNTSDDEYVEDTCTASMVVLGAGELHTTTVITNLSDEAKEEKGLHADYAWRLTNRILGRQKSSEARVTSKWVRERNGKRLTEDDFNSIMHSLRSL